VADAVIEANRYTVVFHAEYPFSGVITGFFTPLEYVKQVP